jgi:hypothetical protein
MKATNYKITIEGTRGAAYAQYVDGVLQMFINDLGKFTQLPRFVPTKEDGLKAMHGRDWKVSELVSKTVSDKAALFCLVYKLYKKIAYRATKTELANLKIVTVNEDLLKTYFESVEFPLNNTKSITDYIRHYNHVRDLSTNGAPKKVKTRFPDVYDKEFERGLEGETLAAYWQRLRELGWKKIDGVWYDPQTVTGMVRNQSL